MTSSLCSIQLFQRKFQLHCQQNHFNSCSKEEHLKGHGDCKMFLVHISPWTQIHSHQIGATKLLLKNIWRSMRQRFPAIWAVQICKISRQSWWRLVGHSWVTKLMESLMTDHFVKAYFDHCNCSIDQYCRHVYSKYGSVRSCLMVTNQKPVKIMKIWDLKQVSFKVLICWYKNIEMCTTLTKIFSVIHMTKNNFFNA